MARIQLTEDILKPVPMFPPGDVSSEQINQLAGALHALQELTVYLFNENGQQAEEIAELKKKPATSRSTKTAAK